MNLEQATQDARAAGTALRAKVKPRIRKVFGSIYAITTAVLLLGWVLIYHPWIVGRGSVSATSDNALLVVFFLLLALGFYNIKRQEQKHKKDT